MKKNVSNKIMLITYPDSLGKNLKDLDFTLSQYLDKAVGGVHILPFFPSSGDRDNLRAGGTRFRGLERYQNVIGKILSYVRLYD